MPIFLDPALPTPPPQLPLTVTASGPDFPRASHYLAANAIQIGFIAVTLQAERITKMKKTSRWMQWILKAIADTSTDTTGALPFQRGPRRDAFIATRNTVMTRISAKA